MARCVLVAAVVEVVAVAAVVVQQEAMYVLISEQSPVARELRGMPLAPAATAPRSPSL